MRSSAAESLAFDPSAFTTFRFTERVLHDDGTLTLAYALDDAHEFVETLRIPMPEDLVIDRDALEPLLDLVHAVAGVSYYKTAAPRDVEFETRNPSPSVAAYLEALYSKGLGEFAVVNDVPVPRPAFPSGPTRSRGSAGPKRLSSVLVPVGGGKDSIVALEIVRHASLEFSLFSVRNDAAMQRTEAAAGVNRLVAGRDLDASLVDLNDRGALNGHVPITALIASIALLVARLHDHDAVVLANERSASEGNRPYDGMTVNHQYSKSAEAEALLRAAAAEAAPGIDIFSVLRPASELAIARRFAELPDYHRAFTSCNAIFRLDPDLRRDSWCGDCPKCRFVFLILAPFMEPEALKAIFGSAMLDDEAQFEGFARLAASGGDKPFECVGEVEESLAAIALLSSRPAWRDRRVVSRLVDEVLGDRLRYDPALAERVLELSDEHNIPDQLIDSVRALLGT